MTFDILVMQLFSGFSLFSVLVLMAIGLTIAFGLMGVINFDIDWGRIWPLFLMGLGVLLLFGDRLRAGGSKNKRT